MVLKKLDIKTTADNYIVFMKVNKKGNIFNIA